MNVNVCRDKDPDCADYGRDYICQGDYIPWAKTNCADFCGLCESQCFDQDPDCAEYGRDYICQGDYIPWASIHCTKFCGFCDTATSGTSCLIVEFMIKKRIQMSQMLYCFIVCV